MVKAQMSDRVLCPDPGTLSLLPPVPRTGEVTAQGQWHLAFRPPATTLYLGESPHLCARCDFWS